jgi:alpha-mannosidase
MNQIHVIAHTHWDQEWYFTRQDSMVLASYNFADVIDTLELDPLTAAITLTDRWR